MSMLEKLLLAALVIILIAVMCWALYVWRDCSGRGGTLVRTFPYPVKCVFEIEVDYGYKPQRPAAPFDSTIA